LADDFRPEQEQSPDPPGPLAAVPLHSCDGQGLRQLVRAGLAWIERHQAVINSLNVYPVPDGDTGTNMLLTMQSAYREVQDSPETQVGVIAHRVAHGALMGARGNSGVILSQILRGFARSLDGLETFDTIEFAAALREAAKTAYQGVIKPVEGTILTVAREAADAAVEAATASSDLRQVLDLVVQEARASVRRTPSLLAVLAEAGVVDAGGQGLAVLLEGMLRQMKGERLTLDTELDAAVDLPGLHGAEEGYGYDVQFVIQGEGLDLDEIRATISAMGDSALVVGDLHTVKVHVHTPEPGTPLNYGVRLGSLSRVIVENMQEQYQEFILGKAQRPAGPPAPVGGIATVAVAPGPGLMEVFGSLGATAVVSGGQTMNPSTEDLLTAVKEVPAQDVILLPNNKNIIMAARQAQALSDKRVEVVPTVTVPQGISALLALNYQADLESNAQVMAQAAEHIQTIEITTAVRSAQINGVKVEKGETIGLLNGTLKIKGHTPTAVCLDALEKIAAGDFEILTLYYGDAVTEDQAQALAGLIGESYPHLEVEVVDGGQPYYSYILSAE
jgi:uncharacterized protein